MIKNPVNIEILIQKSKRLQKKWKNAEFDALPVSARSSTRSEGVPPIWSDSILLEEYVQDVVRNVLDNTGNKEQEIVPLGGVWKPVRDGEEALVRDDDEEGLPEKSQAKVPLESHCLQYRPDSLRLPCTDIVSENKITTPKREGGDLIHDSNINLNEGKFTKMENRTTQKPRKNRKTQYRCFTGPPKHSIKETVFHDEHPGLVLEENYETFFPRRCAYSEKLINSRKEEKAPKNSERIHTSTKEKPILQNNERKHNTRKEEQISKTDICKIVKYKQTWHDELLASKANRKKSPEKRPIAVQTEFTAPSLARDVHKIVRLKQSPTAKQREVIYDSPRVHNVHNSKDLQKKLQLRQFPVLCIRGENRVQNVLKLSIQPTPKPRETISHASVMSGFKKDTKNVQYSEFVHKKKVRNRSENKDKESTRESDIVQNVEPKPTSEIPIAGNRFFKPFQASLQNYGFLDSSRATSTSSSLKSLPDVSTSFDTSKKSRMKSHCKSPNISRVSPTTSDETDDKCSESGNNTSSDVFNIINDVLGHLREREVSVKTDNPKKETSVQTYGVAVDTRTDKGRFQVVNVQSPGRGVESDVVVDIFQRIQKDEPIGLKSFKERLNGNRRSTNVGVNNIAESNLSSICATPRTQLISRNSQQRSPAKSKNSSSSQLSFTEFNSIRRELKQITEKYSIQSLEQLQRNQTPVESSKRTVDAEMNNLKNSNQNKLNSNDNKLVSQRDPEVQRAVQMFLSELDLGKRQLISFSEETSQHFCTNSGNLSEDESCSTSTESKDELNKTFSVKSSSSESDDFDTLSEGEIFSLGEI